MKFLMKLFLGLSLASAMMLTACAQWTTNAPGHISGTNVTKIVDVRLLRVDAGYPGMVYQFPYNPLIRGYENHLSWDENGNLFDAGTQPPYDTVTYDTSYNRWQLNVAGTNAFAVCTNLPKPWYALTNLSEVTGDTDGCYFDTNTFRGWSTNLPGVIVPSRSTWSTNGPGVITPQ